VYIIELGRSVFQRIKNIFLRGTSGHRDLRPGMPESNSDRSNQLDDVTQNLKNPVPNNNYGNGKAEALIPMCGWSANLEAHEHSVRKLSDEEKQGNGFKDPDSKNKRT
jgi:hypothetical protein